MPHSFNKQPFPLRNKVRFELLYRFTVSKPIVFYGETKCFFKMRKYSANLLKFK